MRVKPKLASGVQTTSDGTATFVYNDAGRMVSATKSGVTTSYSLNALGQRVKKSTAGSSTYFVYDTAGHLLGEYDTAGNLVQETVWFGDTPVAVLKPNGGSAVTAFYIHTDHLNTPRRISRPSDNVVVWRWDADPFGAAAANEDADGDTQLLTFNLRFPGQHYNYFRDYDPRAGRYVESDPIGLDGGLNTFAYVEGNPIDLSDPQGLVPGPHTGQKKFPAGHPHCVALKNKIERKRHALDERWADYNRPRDPQLPERLSTGRREALRSTRRGHRVLFNIEDSTLSKLEKRYDKECFDECNQCAGATAGAVVLGLAAGVTVGVVCATAPVSVPVILIGGTAAVASQ